jgi:hypothetical protein
LRFVLLGASPATAQQTPPAAWQPSQSPLVSNMQLTAPWLRGEPTGSAGPSPWVLTAPLRLSLQAPIFPLDRAFPNCVSREEASGNTVNGFPVQRFASLRLAPSLVLFGFSSAGCPVDGALGGGFTYTVPLDRSLRLVAAAGVYGVPTHAPLPARVSADARIDLVKDIDAQRTVSVGVGRRGISVGGSW